MIHIYIYIYTYTLMFAIFEENMRQIRSVRQVIPPDKIPGPRFREKASTSQLRPVHNCGHSNSNSNSIDIKLLYVLLIRRHQTCYFRKHATSEAADFGGKIHNISRNRDARVPPQAQKWHVYGSGTFGAFETDWVALLV